MKPGSRVQTPIGPGTVVYIRFGALSSTMTAEAVSVLLDARKGQPGYSGTIFRVEEVQTAPWSERQS